MKILITDRLSANHFIAESWRNAFNMMQNQAVLWSEDVKCTYDVFQEFSPEIFIGSSWQLNRSQVDCLAKHKDCKILLSVSNWGKEDGKVDKEKFPIHFASDEEKRLVAVLKEKRPDFEHVFAQYHNSYAEETLGEWKQLGVTPFGLNVSADISEYFLTPPQKDCKCDLVFCGGSWKYKNENLHRFLSPLFYPQTQLSLKVFGSGWSGPQSMGYASAETIRKHYASATICPNILEPHSTVFGYDISQRVFQILASGGFCLSQRVASLERDLFPDGGVAYFDDERDYFDSIDHFLKNLQERVQFMQEGAGRVYSHHTNLHRVSTMLGKLGYPIEAQQALTLASDKYIEVVSNYRNMLNES